VTGNGICTFATAWDHTIRITPNVVGWFPKVVFNGTAASGANQHKIISVDQ
jgi:hypothetical protein